MSETNYRHETHSRYENLRLIEAIIGRRDWSDDDENAGGIVSRYPSYLDARRDEERLKAQGLEVAVSLSDRDADEGVNPEREGYLWVIVGE